MYPRMKKSSLNNADRFESLVNIHITAMVIHRSRYHPHAPHAIGACLSKLLAGRRHLLRILRIIKRLKDVICRSSWLGKRQTPMPGHRMEYGSATIGNELTNSGPYPSNPISKVFLPRRKSRYHTSYSGVVSTRKF